MPAGVARQSTLNYQQLKITEQCREFSEELSTMGIQVNSHFTFNADDADIKNAEICLTLLTPCAEKMISVHAPDMNIQGQINIKGSVPLVLLESSAEKSPELWLNILLNGARTQHLLRFWLSHVYWQVARRTTEAQVTTDDGRSIWRFNKPSTEHAKYKGKTTFSLAPIAYETALAELLKWIRFAQIAGSTPMTILPMYAITYLDKVSDAQSKESVYQPKRGDFDSWLWSGYNSDMTYDTCSQHELWQYILQKQDGFTALTDALPVLAEPLFGAMNTALMPL